MGFRVSMGLTTDIKGYLTSVQILGCFWFLVFPELHCVIYVTEHRCQTIFVCDIQREKGYD